MVESATVAVHYYAAARAAAGVTEESWPSGTVAETIAVMIAAHGAELNRVLARCSFLLDGVAVRDRATVAMPGARLDVLPPFAGG